MFCNSVILLYLVAKCVYASSIIEKFVNYLIGNKKVGAKKSRQKIWSVKKLVT